MTGQQRHSPPESRNPAQGASAMDNGRHTSKTLSAGQGSALASSFHSLLNPNWPEARWDISGAFVYDEELILFYKLLRDSYGIIPFSRVHGAPLCLWSSGRLKWQFQQERGDTERTILSYAAQGLALDVTFSSSTLQEKHIADRRGNYILELMTQANPTGSNGVILCSELLAGHVRQHYPTLKRIASVVKAAEEDGRGRRDYYLGTAERYDKVMIHPDDNFNLDLLAGLDDKDKYEILVNEPCFLGCQMRKTHYRLISELSQNVLDSSLEKQLSELFERNRCLDMDRLLLSPDQRTLILANEEIKQLYDLGFRNFKIQGRGLGSVSAMFIEIFRLVFNQEPRQNHLAARVMQAVLSSIAEAKAR
jgi:hypothetical protein